MTTTKGHSQTQNHPSQRKLHRPMTPVNGYSKDFANNLHRHAKGFNVKINERIRRSHRVPGSVHRAVSPRPTYTPKQLNQYFKTIRLPSKYLQHPIIKYKSIAESSDVEALDLLSTLIKYQITNIPYENLELHYSAKHSISIDPEHLFHKMVERKTGRGGYCMENTQLFVTVLRSLGYNVIATGARVNTAIQPADQHPAYSCGPNYDNWNHMVAIVTIGGKRYLVDVGFGNNSPTYPVPLEDGITSPNGRPSRWLRLGREQIPDSTDAPHHEIYEYALLWVYSVRFGPENSGSSWIPAYCFSETEFLPQDFETMALYVSKNPGSWFTTHVICVKFLMDKNTERILGNVTLFERHVQECRNGVVRTLAELKSEKDRAACLQQFLGVRLSDVERRGIFGMKTMIK